MIHYGETGRSAENRACFWVSEGEALDKRRRCEPKCPCIELYGDALLCLYVIKRRFINLEHRVMRESDPIACTVPTCVSLFVGDSTRDILWDALMDGCCGNDFGKKKHHDTDRRHPTKYDDCISTTSFIVRCARCKPKADSKHNHHDADNDIAGNCLMNACRIHVHYHELSRTKTLRGPCRGFLQNPQ
jgi:hypothetical protein